MMRRVCEYIYDMLKAIPGTVVVILVVTGCGWIGMDYVDNDTESDSREFSLNTDTDADSMSSWSSDPILVDSVTTSPDTAVETEADTDSFDTDSHHTDSDITTSSDTISYDTDTSIDTGSGMDDTDTIADTGSADSGSDSFQDTGAISGDSDSASETEVVPNDTDTVMDTDTSEGDTDSETATDAIDSDSNTGALGTVEVPGWITCAVSPLLECDLGAGEICCLAQDYVAMNACTAPAECPADGTSGPQDAFHQCDAHDDCAAGMFCIYMSYYPEVKTYCTNTPQYYRSPEIRTVCNPLEDECPVGQTCEPRNFRAGSFVDEDVGLFTCEKPYCPAELECLSQSDCTTAAGTEDTDYSCNSTAQLCCRI